MIKLVCLTNAFDRKQRVFVYKNESQIHTELFELKNVVEVFKTLLHEHLQDDKLDKIVLCGGDAISEAIKTQLIKNIQILHNNNVITKNKPKGVF